MTKRYIKRKIPLNFVLKIKVVLESNVAYVMLCLVFLILIIDLQRNLSPVQSEDAHLASGTYHWISKEFDLYRVNPPLIRLTASLPVFFLYKDILKNLEQGHVPYPLLREEFDFGNRFVREHADSFVNFLRLARLASLIFFVFSCISFYFVTKIFYRNGKGIFALLTYCLVPYTLGHTATIMPDAHAASMGLLSFCCFGIWLKKPSFKTLILSGVSLGLAELSKYTLIVLYPTYVVVLAVYRIGRDRSFSLRHICVIFLNLIAIFVISIAVISLGYLCKGIGRPLNSYTFQSRLFKTMSGSAGYSDNGKLKYNLIMPLPSDYIQGIDTQRCDFERGMPSYLRGQWSDHGWWYYYLYALLIKVPIGIIGIFVLSIICSLFLKGYNESARDEISILLPGILILIFVSSQSGFSCHSRYMLPAMPFFFVWMSKVTRSFDTDIRNIYPRSSFFVRCATVLLLVLTIVSVFADFRHPFSYFNELTKIIPTTIDDISSPFTNQILKVDKNISKSRFSLNPSLYGPRHLLGSNVDWGQDLFELESWCNAHSEVRHIKTSLAGSFPPSLTKIPCEENVILKSKPEPGWYALSVNYLFNVDRHFLDFADYTPIEIIGNSVYIYYIPASGSNNLNDRDQLTFSETFKVK